MKKSTKIILIVAASMLLGGGFLTFLTISLGAGSQFQKMVMANELDFDIPAVDDLKLKIDTSGVYFTTEDGEKTIIDSSTNGSSSDNASEITSKYIASDEEVSSIELELAAGEIYLKKSMDDTLYAEVEGDWFINTELRNGKLVISTSKFGVLDFFKDEEVSLGKSTIYVPEKVYDLISIDAGAAVVSIEDMQADTVSLEVGAGEITIDSLKANEFDVEVAAGTCEIKKMGINKMDAEIAMGELNAAGEVNEKLSVEVGMGAISLELLGKEEDYDYSVDCGAGEVRIGSWNYGGIAGDENRDNPGDKKIDVECGMGEVDIRFAQ